MALAGAGMTGATFDATDLTPEYQTGIQNVYAVADDGTEVIVPVYSLPECVEEDGTGDPCVWNASVRGNGIGQSYVQLGTEENRIFADVTVWAAEILVDQTAVQSVQVVEPVEVPVQAITPVEVEEPVQAIHPVNPEEWAGAECDAQCEEDMANDFAKDSSNDVIDNSSLEGITMDEAIAMGFPYCENETSENCVWDASILGNGEGTNFVDVDGTAYYDTK